MKGIDHEKLGKSIAENMGKQGHIKAAVEGILHPILETHKEEIIQDNAKMLRDTAMRMGVNCNEPLEMQKDFAHLRTGRIERESTIRKVREWGIRGVFVAFLAYLGLDKFM